MVRNHAKFCGAVLNCFTRPNVTCIQSTLFLLEVDRLLLYFTPSLPIIVCLCIYFLQCYEIQIGIREVAGHTGQTVVAGGTPG